MTNAYASSILRKTLCRDSQFNKQNHHPMKRLKCICAVSAFLLFLGLFVPQVAWGQFKYYYSGYYYNTSNLSTAISYTSSGGTIYMYANGNIGGNISIRKNITIAVQNTSDYGDFTLTRDGAYTITVNSGYTLTIKNIIIDGNNISSTKSLFWVEGTMNMAGQSKTDETIPDHNNCKIINSLKTNSSPTNGAAVHVYRGRLVCNGVTFENNENRDIHTQTEGLTYGGGALAFHDGASFSLTNCHFYNNKAYESGGAILLEYAGNSSIRNCTFGDSGKPNTAYLGGGAIYGLMQNGKALDIEGNTTFQYNQVVYNETTGIINPLRMGWGGAACLITFSTTSSTFNIGTESSSKIVFNNNYARFGGGALVLWCANPNARFKLCNFSMENNWTDCIGTDNESGGGALFVHGANSEGHSDDHFIIQNGVIRNNHSINYGGAMLIDMHDCKVENVTFESNYTTVASNGRGGGVMIFGNESSYTHTNQFINCNFYKNGINGSTTTTEFGGAIYSVAKTNIQLLGCTVGGSSANANKATGHGGGIYIGSDAYLTMDSQVATGTYNTMEVSYNEAGNDGGGIYVANGSQGHTNIGSNSNVSYPVKTNNNVAAFNGGGIALHCSGTANDLFTLRNFELKSNRALQGGGAYLQGGHISGENHGAMTISNGTVQDNHAASAGGGIYFDEHDANVSYVDFIHNTTNKGTTSSNTGAGGGVLIAGHSNHAVADHDHDFTNCTFTQNEASFGGAAMIMRKTTAKFINCTIGGSGANKNTASINGGGVYVEELSKADFINGTKVSYNEAVNGGGVYVNGFIETGGSNKLSIDCGASINVYPYEQMGEYFGIYTKNESGVYELVAGTDMSLTGSTSSLINVSNLQAETDYYVRTKLLGSYITDDYSWYYQIQCELSGVVGKIRVYDNEWHHT